MESLYVYGAGSLTKFFLPLIQRYYNVLAVLDSNPDKVGTTICGVPVLPVQSDKSIPVCICIRNIESALETLGAYSFSDILFVMGLEVDGYGVIFRYQQGMTLTETALCAEPVNVLLSDAWNIETAQWTETSQQFDPDIPRVFNLALFPDEGQMGGPMATNRNLMNANLNYGAVDNFFSVNTTQIVVPCGYLKNLRKTTQEIRIKTNREEADLFARLSKGMPVYNHISSIWRRFLIGEWLLKKADNIFQFCERDVFLVNDFRDAQAFANVLPRCKHVLIGYHEQGALSSVMNRSGAEKEFYDRVQLDHLSTFSDWIFPSYGTYDGFVNTASEDMRLKLRGINRHIAYNGFNKRALKPECIDEETAFLMRMLQEKKQNRLVFISASILYNNKGVEQVPLVLKRIKEQFGIDIFWLLIGDGEKHAAVEESITQNLNEEEFFWQKERLSTQDNLFNLFNIADFYIMMHRVSVFDLSTLQAMAYGCVPVLSDVGGNKEFCAFGNGALIGMNTTRLDENLGKLLKDRPFLQSMKEKNTQIVETEFNDEVFLRRYVDIFQKQDKGDDKNDLIRCFT